jgi:uncharacterized protein (DUF1015 family)
MAEIKSFKALRYNLSKSGSIDSLTCPPYDIISDSQKDDLLSKNPYNVIRLELPSGSDPYASAHQTLDSWLDSGILTRDMDDGIYVYEEEFLSKVDHGEKKRIRGIICRVKIEDFSAGIILPHEETLSKAKEDRFNLMKATHCNFSQIYSLYIDKEHKTLRRINNVASSCEPVYNFSDGLVSHRMWIINDQVTIKAICDDFIDKKLYIADGHHRYETSINYRNYCRENGLDIPDSNYVMMMLVDMDDPGLEVFPTHRLLRNLPEFSSSDVLEKCSKFFDISEFQGTSSIEGKLQDAYNANDKSFCFYVGNGKWYLLKLKDPSVMKKFLPDKSDDYRNLDVTVLHTLILENILKIDKANMANQLNLLYTRSLDEAISSVDDRSCQCSFIINPTKVQEISHVASNGEKMPQKSTYFYPKLITGLVINKLD